MMDMTLEELQARYRLTFLHGVGKDVLVDLLTACHFGATLDPENAVQIAEYNVGVVLLSRLGITGPGMMEDIVNALAQVVPQKEMMQ